MLGAGYQCHWRQCVPRRRHWRRVRMEALGSLLHQNGGDFEGSQSAMIVGCRHSEAGTDLPVLSLGGCFSVAAGHDPATQWRRLARLWPARSLWWQPEVFETVGDDRWLEKGRIGSGKKSRPAIRKPRGAVKNEPAKGDAEIPRQSINAYRTVVTPGPRHDHCKNEPGDLEGIDRTNADRADAAHKDQDQDNNEISPRPPRVITPFSCMAKPAAHREKQQKNNQKKTILASSENPRAPTLASRVLFSRNRAFKPIALCA